MTSSQIYWPKEKPKGDRHPWLKRAVAAVELLLVSPAAFFMTAVFLRGARPNQQEPSFTAQQIVQWYSERPWTLWILLITMPLAALIIGVLGLRHTWLGDVELRQTADRTLEAVRAYGATLLVAVATLVAAGILLIVVVHSLAS